MTAVVASSGGLMFGYDNGVTGGVTNMIHFLDRFFPTVRMLLLTPLNDLLDIAERHLVASASDARYPRPLYPELDMCLVVAVPLLQLQV